MGLITENEVLAKRFWSKVDKSGGPDSCWPWTGYCHPKTGYGTFTIGGYTKVDAHRVAWELIYGSIPEGMCVLHKCDNRPCCNPKCLFQGTRGDNARDKCDKGRHHNQVKTHCPKGHPYNEENTVQRGRGRVCRTCHPGY